MNFWKRFISLVIVLVVMLTLFSGCGEKVKSPDESNSKEEVSQEKDNKTEVKDDKADNKKDSENVELNMYTWTDDGAYMQGIVDNYNNQSDLAEVKLTIIPSDEYEDKMITMIAGGADLDLFNNRSMQFVSRYASTDNLYDLTDLINEQVDVAPYGTSYAETRIDDKFYAMPYRQLSYVLFYNKKIFDDENIPYPDDLTWDEYAELALELTHGEGSDKFYGGYIPEWLGISYIPQQKGSNYADDDISAIQEGLEFQNRLYNVDNSHMSYIEMKSTGTDYLQFFCSSKAAMLPNGDWCLGDIQRVLDDNPALNEEFDLGIAFLPQVNKGEQITCGGVSTFVSMNVKTEYVDPSFDFMKYLCGPDAALQLAEAGMLPAYVSDETIEKYKSTAEGILGVENLLIGDKVPEGLFFPEYAEIANIFSEEKELYLIGSQDIEETMNNFVERREDLMK